MQIPGDGVHQGLDPPPATPLDPLGEDPDRAERVRALVVR